MQTAILALALLYILLLAIEKLRTTVARRSLKHVIHVNGTRGKSTVSRLIDAGLRAGGLKVFCKTTGTDPMTIDVSGEEKPIRRVGMTNIREQLDIMRRASKQNADALVIECMAVDPRLQRVAEQSMLKSDIGVITNVRRDHTDVMGDTLEEICDALSNTIPSGGVLFTAEIELAERLERNAELRKCRFVQVVPDGTEPDIGFPDNIALALAVCEYIGVEREAAIEGMKLYHPDPYALSAYKWRGGYFVNGLSVNDITSAQLALERVKQKLESSGKLTLLVNNRADRGARTHDMLELTKLMRPERVFVSGASATYFMKRLALENIPATRLSGAEALQGQSIEPNEIVFAVGNIAGMGRAFIALMEKEGERIV